MKPGTTFAEIIDFVRGLGAKRGLKTEFVMHGRRWGDDGRLITPRANQDRISDVRIEKGHADVRDRLKLFASKRAMPGSGNPMPKRWMVKRISAGGGCVVVTDGGGERLFQRAHGLVSIT